jgi:hypothetical protein
MLACNKIQKLHAHLLSLTNLSSANSDPDKRHTYCHFIPTSADEKSKKSRQTAGRRSS